MDFKNMKFKIDIGAARGLSYRGCGRQDCQLNTYDYLADIPGNNDATDLVEVQFKNTIDALRTGDSTAEPAER